MKKVGVLALQGSFGEHGDVLKKLREDFVWVRTLEDLKNITHLIVPGGESTTLTNLLKSSGMWDHVVSSIKNQELRVFGTCAGAILCAEWGMGVDVDRNAYGAQQSSFIDALDSEKFPDLEGVFIRAPKLALESGSSGQKILASYKDEPVLIEQGSFLIASFHPELTGDVRLHEYFCR